MTIFSNSDILVLSKSFFNKDSYFFRGLGTEMNLRMHDTTVNDYLGEWRMSDDEMAEMVRNTIRNLGRKPEDFFAERLPTTVVKPVKMGSYVIPRCFMSWSVDAQKHSGITISQVRAEVDANNKRLLAFTWCCAICSNKNGQRLKLCHTSAKEKLRSLCNPSSDPRY